YQEMQEITGVAMGTVKSRVHRAREALAGAL
ncbi:MAG: RNA polymerase subunit sigma, partial [Methylobacterium sp.]|nr:RNA polymerase subunit sigma [Methylobacterium sp.]